MDSHLSNPRTRTNVDIEINGKVVRMKATQPVWLDTSIEPSNDNKKFTITFILTGEEPLSCGDVCDTLSQGTGEAMARMVKQCIDQERKLHG